MPPLSPCKQHCRPPRLFQYGASCFPRTCGTHNLLIIVEGIKCLLSPKHWDRGVESHLRHGRLTPFCLCCPVQIESLRQGWWPAQEALLIVYAKSFTVPGDSDGKDAMISAWTVARNNNNNNSVALVRERTIPTERPPLVGEVNANFCG
jgi:hypothetical protein